MPRTISNRIVTTVLYLLAVLAVGPASARDGETDHLQGQAREIADWLIAGQRAGWEDHDVESYLAQWHADAKLVLARAEEPSEYDLAVSMDRLKPTRRLRMHGPSTGRKLSMSDIAVSINDNEATVTWRCISASADQSSRELMRERYLLQRTEAGWTVLENRTWFLGLEEDGEKTPFNEVYWAQHDTIAERATRQEDYRRARQALFNGYRFDQAHDAAIKATELADATVDDWLWRGIIAAIAYRPEDAKLSFKKAIALDPDTWLPSYAKESDWIHEP